MIDNFTLQWFVDSGSQYFRVWASAASAHDDDRAVKRLRTRQRFVNLAEEKMAQKQKHCKSSHANTLLN